MLNNASSCVCFRHLTRCHNLNICGSVANCCFIRKLARCWVFVVVRECRAGSSLPLYLTYYYKYTSDIASRTGNDKLYPRNVFRCGAYSIDIDVFHAVTFVVCIFKTMYVKIFVGRNEFPNVVSNRALVCCHSTRNQCCISLLDRQFEYWHISL